VAVAAQPCAPAAAGQQLLASCRCSLAMRAGDRQQVLRFSKE
jgi:hypothetical protein